MDEILMDKLTDRVSKLIARCQELERLNHELVESQQQLLADRELTANMNEQIAHTLTQVIRQLTLTEESR